MMERTATFMSLAKKAKTNEDALYDINNQPKDPSSTLNKKDSNAPDAGDVKLNNKNLLTKAASFSRLWTPRNWTSTNGGDTKNGNKHGGCSVFDFGSEVKSLTQTITALKNFLEENRKDYLSKSISLLTEFNESLSDTERDKIDHEAEQLIKLCKEILNKLEKSYGSSSANDNVQLKEYEKQLTNFSTEDVKLHEKTEHQRLVLKSLENYLKQVCDVYTEQKAVRIKSNIEKRQFLRLETAAGSKLRKRPSMSSKAVSPPAGSPGSNNSGIGVVSPIESSASAAVVNEAVLSEDELQQLELENKQMFNELQGMDDQVKVIEGQVVEISRLQSIFTEKVLSQNEQIEKVHMTAVNSSENIKEGNEHVRDAIRNNAGLRFWVLFFLVVSSFSLLFLDWYDT